LILYMDSSSIVKLYVQDESGITETRTAAVQADYIATSAIAYAEVRAAFARMRRSGRVRSARAHRGVVAAFETDWPSFLAVNVSSEIIHRAGELTETHPLSGYDALHLASALGTEETIPESITLSTWDNQLSRAAKAEGLSLAHEVKP
jgi:predicted nucleic acid-binding protein